MRVQQADVDPAGDLTDGHASAAPWRAGPGRGHDDLEGHERVRVSHRGNYGRLAQIKAADDPGDLFRVNHNIQPKA